MHTLEMPLKRMRFDRPTGGACKESHTAQVLAVTDVQQLSKLKWLSYLYIGRRARHDPPFCTSLVSQRMPLDLADRFCALLLFLTKGSVRDDCFVVKLPHDIADPQNVESCRRRYVTQRTQSVNALLFELHARFTSRDHLLQSVGLRPEAVRNPQHAELPNTYADTIATELRVPPSHIHHMTQDQFSNREWTREIPVSSHVCIFVVHSEPRC